MARVIKKTEIDYPYLEKPLSIYTFENGHKAVLAHKNSPIINISSWVKTGSINENDENNGVSHFVEHLLFKGTAKYPAGVFDKTMEQKGGIINAATWKDYTFYYINIPKEHFKIALEMHSDMIVDARFPDDEIGPEFDPDGKAPEQKRERYVVIEEIRMGEDNNWRRIYKNLNSSMYENHPYKREVIGTKEIIANISREEIKRYYDTFYTPKNITTIVAGEFEEEYVVDLIQKNFIFKDNSKLKNFQKCKTDKYKKETKIKKPHLLVDYARVNSGYIMMGALCDSAKNLKETIALDLLSTILGSGKSSRLYHNLIEREKEPYFYQIETCHYQFKDGDNFFIEGVFNPSRKEEAVRSLKEHLDNLDYIEERELEKAKKRARVNFAQDSETVSDIADTIGYYATVAEDISLASKYLAVLDKIDCTYLEKVAMKYLNSDAISTAILLPKGEN